MLERLTTKLINIPLDFMTEVMGIPFSLAIGINSIVLGISIISVFVYIAGKLLI